MGKRKITILDRTVEEIASIAYYIESKGMPKTAKLFVADVFEFIETLNDERIIHKPCKYFLWQIHDYRCVNYKKKFVIAYLDNEEEIIICDFAAQKILKG